MTTIGNDVGPSGAGGLVLAFAKLKGENFEYYMQKYSIILGRGSGRKSVDLDLRNFGGSLAVSRHHARIFYDFNLRCFQLEVLGRNGCIIENTHYMPGSSPINLNSQDFLQIGEARFYFLLPSRPFVVPLEAARQMSPPLPPLLVAVPVVSSNDERKGEERECNREDILGIGHGEGDVSSSFVEESDAREAELSFDGPSGGALDAAGQIASPLLPPLVVVPPASNNERKAEERKGEGRESLSVGQGGGLSGMIVEEFNAREAGGLSSEQLGAAEAAQQIELPLTPKLVVVPLACISNERKGKEKEVDREESQGTGNVEVGVSGLVIVGFIAKEAGGPSSEQSAAVKAATQIEGDATGFIVEEFSAGESRVSSGTFEAAKKAGVSSGEQSGALEAAMQRKPPQLVVIPLASYKNVKNCEEKEGEMVERPGVEHGEGDVCGLIAEQLSATEAEGSSGGLSGALEAAMEIVPSLHSPLSVAPPTYSNNERNGKEGDGDWEEILGIDHGKGGGLIVEELTAREADGLPGMRSGDMEHFSSPNEKHEARSRSDREADNQEETSDVHAFKADLPGIKEQIKLEVEHVDCHSAHAGDQEI